MRPPTARRRSRRAARQVEAVIVVGAANSSNSQRLREVAEREGSAAQLVPDAGGDRLGARSKACGSLAITAGASAPEALVERIVEALGERYAIALETLTTANESVAFPLPRGLREAG